MHCFTRAEVDSINHAILIGIKNTEKLANSKNIIKDLELIITKQDSAILIEKPPLIITEYIKTFDWKIVTLVSGLAVIITIFTMVQID